MAPIQGTRQAPPAPAPASEPDGTNGPGDPDGADSETQRTRVVHGDARKRHREVKPVEELPEAKLAGDAERRAYQQGGGPGGDMPITSDAPDRSSASDPDGDNDSGIEMRDRDKDREEERKREDRDERAENARDEGNDGDTEESRAVQDGARKPHQELEPAEALPDTRLAKDVIDEARHAQRKAKQDVKRTRRNLGNIRTKTLREAVLHDFFTIKAIYLAGFVWQPFYLKVALSVFIPSLIWLIIYFRCFFSADRYNHHHQLVGPAKRAPAGDISFVFDHPLGSKAESDKATMVDPRTYVGTVFKGHAAEFTRVHKLMQQCDELGCR